MQLHFYAFLALFTLWTIVEVDCAAGGQWNFDKIGAEIDKLVKKLSGQEKGGMKMSLDRRLKGRTKTEAILAGLRGLAKELGQNPREYRADMLALVEKYANDFKIGELLKAIRAQFIFGLPLEEFAKIKGEMAKAKSVLKREGKGGGLLDEFHQRFSELMDQLKGGQRGKYEQFRRAPHWRTLLASYPQYLAGFVGTDGNFGPKWVPAKELEEIKGEIKHLGATEKGHAAALEELYNLRYAINLLVVYTAKRVDQRIRELAKENEDETMEAIKYENVLVYTSYTDAILKLGQTLLEIASFGQFTFEDVAKQAGGRKLMAMACLLHKKWIVPFSERAKGLEAQRREEMAKVDEIRQVKMVAAEQIVKELEAEEKVGEGNGREKMAAGQGAKENGEVEKVRKIAKKMEDAKKRVAELEAERDRLNAKLDQILRIEVVKAGGIVKKEAAQILELFKQMDGRFKMCENVAKSSHEGKKAEVEAGTELAAMPKARDIPETASGDCGLVYYQMFLDGYRKKKQI